MDVSPRQMVSVATALIPFLEHDDANRALMGSNMQRQAVPLLRPQAPLVGTGMEHRAVVDTGEILRARRAGVVERVDSRMIVDPRPRTARSTSTTCRSSCAPTRAPASTTARSWPRARRSSRGTGARRRPVDRAAASSRSARTCSSRSCRGRATTTRTRSSSPSASSRKTCSPRSTSRSTRSRLATPSSAPKRSPARSRTSARTCSPTSTRTASSASAPRSSPATCSSARSRPKGETELTAEERLLRAIFGEKAREVRDTSLKVPHGETGRVIPVRKFSRDAGDDLSPGVNELVRVYVAQKRKINEGDKLAGRHGNKGVISKILPIEDMPFLADGTPVDIILNPLGVPSPNEHRAAARDAPRLGGVRRLVRRRQAEGSCRRRRSTVATPVFDGAREDEIADVLEASDRNLDARARRRATASKSMAEMVPSVGRTGKAVLYDGRTGEPFREPVTVGQIYILKLLHLVDDKIHARSTGPYSLITQQPLGGKAQFGGQRFGEMEVWALYAYGAAYVLQEILTIKSDDVVGRVKAYEAIVKGENIPEPGIPESRSRFSSRRCSRLCLDVEIISESGEEIELQGRGRGHLQDRRGARPGPLRDRRGRARERSTSSPTRRRRPRDPELEDAFGRERTLEHSELRHVKTRPAGPAHSRSADRAE